MNWIFELMSTNYIVLNFEKKENSDEFAFGIKPYSVDGVQDVGN